MVYAFLTTLIKYIMFFHDMNFVLSVSFFVPKFIIIVTFVRKLHLFCVWKSVSQFQL